MKNDPVYRAKIISQRVDTLALTIDCEFIELMIAAACGTKGALIQVPFPRMNYRNNVGSEFNYYKFIADIGTEIETQSHLTH